MSINLSAELSVGMSDFMPMQYSGLSNLPDDLSGRLSERLPGGLPEHE